MNTFKTALLLGVMTLLLLFAGQAIGGRTGMTVALVMAGAMNFVGYFFSDKIALASSGAIPLSQEENPEIYWRVYRIVERLAAKMNVPVPKLYMIPSDSPNAFATGRNPNHAAVAVTAGVLQLLNDEELEGVLAHELGHVKNRDILISSVAAMIAGAITYLAHVAQWGMMFGGYGRGRDDDERGGGGFAQLLLIFLAPLAAMLIQMAVSRQREYEADKTGAELTNNPYGLAHALEKLDGWSKRVPLEASATTAHLFIVKPFSGESMMNLFSTHPPIADRIERLIGHRPN